jgi:hypothetical protein
VRAIQCASVICCDDHSLVPQYSALPWGGHQISSGGAPSAGLKQTKAALLDAHLLNDVRERAHDLFHRRERIGAVRKDEVDVIDAKALQRRVDGLNDVFSRQPLRRWSPSGGWGTISLGPPSKPQKTFVERT